MKHFLLAATLFFLGVFPFQTQAQPQQGETAYVQVRLIPARTHVSGGETILIAIEQNIASEWHTYWVNPGDSGAAPQLKWSLPDGFAAGEIHWPTPHRIPYADLVNYGYEGTITMLQSLTMPATLPEGAVTLGLEMEILVCRDICIPEIKTLTLTLNDPAQEPADNTAAITAAMLMMPLPMEGHGTYLQDGNDLVITITSNALPDALRERAVILPLEWGILKNSGLPYLTSPDPRTLILRQQRDTRDLTEIRRFPVLLTYSTAEGQYAALEIVLTPDPAAPLSRPETETAPPPPVPQIDMTLAQAFFFALLGGLVLNLMPCVFPVLSIKAMKLAQMKEKSAGLTALNGLAYSAGILVSFALIGTALLVLKSAGGQIGWGFQLQDPLVILALAYLLFVIGLNFSGVFDFSGAFANTGASFANKHGLSGAFFTGVLATLVATPCTAPFMAGALGYALVQPAPIAMGVFLALGLGLALPYLLLCLIPGAAKILPRPGIWMIRMKEFLAFPMYASAAWLVWVLSMQTGTAGMLWALLGMVAIAFALWLLSHRPSGRAARLVLTVIALLALLLAALPLLQRDMLHPPAQTANTEQQEATGVNAFSAQTLAQALASGKPVFTYMTAAWCITCKVNEKVALANPDTLALFRQEDVTVLKGDWTNRNPEITAYLERYKRSGIPLYVYYGPENPVTRSRPDPVILPQILTPGLIAAAIRGNDLEKNRR